MKILVLFFFTKWTTKLSTRPLHNNKTISIFDSRMA